MPQCPACGRKGWFLRVDPGLGLCGPCAAAYFRAARGASQALMQGLNRLRQEPGAAAEEGLRQEMAREARRLSELMATYAVRPGEALQEVLDLLSGPEGPTGGTNPQALKEKDE